jgi:probable F420-dependent oxidoreductase
MQNEFVPIGRVGIWTFTLDFVPSSRTPEHVAELEALGYGALWIPEAVGRDALVSSSLLLRGGERIVVATGIASIWARDAMAMSSSYKTITEAHPHRFLLGLGVSHQPMVDAFRGHHYDKPLTAMREYLEKMDAALFMATEPPHPPQRVLAALGPKMLTLAAEKAAGAHPYFVPPEHTAIARSTLGPEPLLAVEQAVVLETDPTKAREIARRHTGTYTPLPNYTNNLRRFGFGDDDFLDKGSDRLVDAIVAWGDLDTIVTRVKAHLDAGADHVCVQVIDEHAPTPPTEAWRNLAPALLSL